MIIDFAIVFSRLIGLILMLLEGWRGHCFSQSCSFRKKGVKCSGMACCERRSMYKDELQLPASHCLLRNAIGYDKHMLFSSKYSTVPV
jgi:hypothetical protein